MNEEPSQPGEISGDMDCADLRNRCGAPDRGEAAFIHVMEVLARRVLKIACDGLRNGTSLLHGDWASTISWDSELFAQRRSCDSSGPKDYRGRNSFFTHPNYSRSNSGHHR